MNEEDVALGSVYRDKLTGWEGVAISKHIYIHGCTRVTLQRISETGDLKTETFDAPALVDVDSGAEIVTQKTGGPRPTPAPRAGE